MVPQPCSTRPAADQGTTITSSAVGSVTMTYTRAVPAEPLRLPILRGGGGFVPPPPSRASIEMRLRLAAMKRARQAQRQSKGMKS